MTPSSRKPALKVRGHKPAFSVVTIVRNESHRLPTLLASLHAFRAQGGEVVVLDTGSTDNTVQVARDAGCVVSLAPRRFNRMLSKDQANRINGEFATAGEGPLVHAGDRFFNVADARNAADRLAKHPFILAVDASDVIEAMDLTLISAAIRSGDAEVLPFETRRLHQGQWVMELRDYFHDRRTAKWSGRAHNFLRSRQGLRRLTMAPLSPAHFRVTHTTDETKNRGYQLTGLALDVLDSPSDAHRRLLFAYELSSRGHFQSAIALFQSVDHDGAAPRIRSAALSAVASCLVSLGQGGSDAVSGLLFEATRRDSSHRGPWLQLARAALGEGQFALAVSHAMAALAIAPRVSSTELDQNLREAPHEILYWALLWLGRKDEAREHFRICLQLAPDKPVYAEHARFLSPERQRGGV
ncbi:MAG: glycosyltransferase [Vicinamibacteria bacterium]